MNRELSAFLHHNHRDCARSALIRAEAMAAERGLRLTPVRRRTLEILLEDHRALGAYEVLDRLAADGFGRQPPVVYRALEFLVDHGLAHRIERLNAFAACTHPASEHQPAFLICTGCNRIAEAPADAIRRAFDTVGAEAGFAIAATSLEATGTCGTCRGGRS
ncbi:MAG: Fur family transcriptional regulator [Gemmobacter sp.]